MSRTEPTFRRIPLSRRSHITGFQPLAAGIVEHESALERDFVTLTSFLDAEAAITAQPITLTFRHEGRSRRYTPDYLVRWKSRRTELIEIKYQADLDANAERLRPAFATAHAWADRAEATFRIVTEQEIRGPALVNAKRLLPLLSLPIDREAAERVLQTVASLTTPTFGRVVAALPLGQLADLANVWRLIARRELLVDMALPITNDTVLSLS